MSRKISAARREAFFRALAETGNQTIAAERAKVSRSWVTLHRAADPAFRARVDTVMDMARRRLRREQGRMTPPPRWRSLHEEELVMRATRGGRAQIARARLHQWTPRVEARFLAALAQCCSVKLACAEAGMSVAGAYAHRKRWPGFAARWDAAIAEGHENVRRAMMESAIDLMSPEPMPADTPFPEMRFADALHLLGMHKRRALGFGGSEGS